MHMKILILSITTGGGHNVSAKALMQEAEKQGAECVLADAYLTVSKLLYHFIDWIYQFCGGAGRHLYGFFYRWAEKHLGSPFKARLAAKKNARRTPRILALIEREKPDVILYTHVFAGEILEALRKKGQLQVPCVGICTDFTLHPHWERIGKLGHLVLPHEDMAAVAVKRSFVKEKIHPFGIPILPSFAETTAKEEARAALGIPCDKKCVLVMCGSMGYGNPAKLVKRLDASQEEFRLLVVCGHNKRGYHKVQKLKTRHEKAVYGFTDQVRLLMDSADCLVSKPGGLSVSEALSQGKPLIIVNPIPGHEVRNAQFLCQRGAALSALDFPSPTEALDRYLQDPALAEDLAEKAAAMAHPHAARDIVSLAIALGKENTQDENENTED